MNASLHFHGIGPRIAALGIAQIINWGALYYTLALIGPPIIAETGWSEGFVYSGFALAVLLMGAVGPLSGKWVDRRGGLPVMLAGTALSASGLLVLSQAHDKVVFLTGWAMMGIGMSACLYDTSFASLARLSGPMTRRAISGLTLVAGFSSTVTWPVTSVLLTVTDWRGVCLLDMVAMLGLSAPLILFALRPFDQDVAPSIDETSVRDEGRPLRGQALIPQKHLVKAMLLFTLIFTAQGFVLNAMSIHVLSLFDALGMGAGLAMLAGTLIGPSQVGARLIELLFGRNLSVMALGLLTMALFPLALALPLIMAPTLLTALLFGVTYGASAGLSTIARGVMPYELFGAEGYGRRLGLLSAPALVAKAFAPASIAMVIESAGPRVALMICIAIATLAFVATLALQKIARQSA